MIIPVDFFPQVLQQIGAPVSENNISILKNWSVYEGGDATFNPLNTTEHAIGATVYNTAGVKNYPDSATGIDATAKTLMNGYYPHILAALKGDLPLSRWYGNAGIISDLDTWGTVDLANELKRGTAPAEKKK